MKSPENWKATGMLRRLVKEEKYALITTHTSLAAFFTRLAVKGMTDRPRLVNVVHGYLFDDNTPFLKRRLLLNAERVAAPETDLLLTMNQWDYEAARKYRLGKRIEKIPGIGVDFSRLDSATEADGAALRKEYGIAPDAFVLIYPAEFSERKSQRVLIEAMRYLPANVLLALPGDGALLDDCKALAERLEVGCRVIFPGYISDIAPWYRMANAAVSASRSEGLPFNIMEAMYMGLPVVASAVKGHTDLIRDGETGLLYPYGDAEACAAQMRRLMGDAEFREIIGVPGKVSVQRYDVKCVLPKVMETYSADGKTSLPEQLSLLS